ncbi:hypothetical protein K1T71_008097 [Dendrolimus kikuchii]|uniref:Uncharacterized protein n=1 Tax=Dendrolimus kikuchii TaxID=765133 RepID=A0ACC1CW94_9NEOP|nr:hypothetical protein K1T71_008097 [Dendrolimus kikuchii]
MSVLFQTVINTGKLYSFRKSLNTTLSNCKCLLQRKYSDTPKKFYTFDEVVAQRRAEAKRSIVVQVNSDASFNELYGYCSKYANINGIHHYKNNTDEHFMLIEFSSEEDLKDVLHTCSSHQKDIDVMALQSPFLWFRASTSKKEKFTIPKNINLMTNNGCRATDEDALFEDLMNCKTVSEQIQLLYDQTALNDLGVRLRYMIARQLECVFDSLYANVVVRPFGSSVNGFGRMGCDLDLVLTNELTGDMTDPSRRLVYQEKKCEGGRSPWQRHMELVAGLLELRVPGAGRVQRILHARVPIVKYAHDLAGVDCDLCYSNMSGVYMSELLWLLGSLDPRVRPLTFVVRRWAQAAGLTNPHPGRWITNFPLTLMVLFFLQHDGNGGRILPSFKELVRQAGKEDVRLTDENLNCTFLRDLNKLAPETYGANSANLETLLLQFFEFYSRFDFKDKAISINEGNSIRKPNSLPLYIVNPLEQALNVSRNVSFEECERMRVEVRNAAWQLDESKSGDDWGLLGIIEKKTTRNLKKLLQVGNSHRLVSVKDLFKDSESSTVNELRSKIERVTKKTGDDGSELPNEQKMKFKNNQIGSEIRRIMRDKIV